MSKRRNSAGSPAFFAFMLSGWIAAGLLWFQKGALNPMPLDRPPPPAHASERTPADRILRSAITEPGLEAAALAFCVLDPVGSVVYESPLARTALVPASAVKTLTTGAALGLLGPDFKFQTRLETTVPMVSGAIAGDLVLAGGGDPTLSFGDLDAIAQAAADTGLLRVEGTLRADVSIFPANPMSDHWNWGDVGNAYGAGAFGLNVNHNRLIVNFRAGTAIDAPAAVDSTEPALEGYTWNNFVSTAAGGSGDQVVVYSQPFGRSVTLRGTVPLDGGRFPVKAALPDPPATALAFLRSALESRGVTFAEATSHASDDADRQMVAKHESASLREIINHLHQVSDNLESQCIFLMLGNHLEVPPAEAVRDYWIDQGLSFEGLRLVDGSGLARANTIRAVDLARVNFLIRNGLHGEIFLSSLPSSLEGAVRSKPGAMSGVRTDVGFITTSEGEQLTYALLGNGLGSKADFWKLRGQLLEEVIKPANSPKAESDE
jgi:D-alanyl-D-alanine carboxypeptidase/D-alanyl-D-alanine-endopeptidase (penicillin-binding protein 4)